MEFRKQNKIVADFKSIVYVELRSQLLYLLAKLILGVLPLGEPAEEADYLALPQLFALNDQIPYELLHHPLVLGQRFGVLALGTAEPALGLEVGEAEEWVEALQDGSELDEI